MDKVPPWDPTVGLYLRPYGRRPGCASLRSNDMLTPSCYAHAGRQVDAVVSGPEAMRRQSAGRALGMMALAVENAH